MTTTQDIVAKLWNLCHVLRDDGTTYYEYVTAIPAHGLVVLYAYITGALSSRFDRQLCSSTEQSTTAKLPRSRCASAPGVIEAYDARDDGGASRASHDNLRQMGRDDEASVGKLGRDVSKPSHSASRNARLDARR